MEAQTRVVELTEAEWAEVLVAVHHRRTDADGWASHSGTAAAKDYWTSIADLHRSVTDKLMAADERAIREAVPA